MTRRQIFKEDFSGFDVFEEPDGSFTVNDRSNMARYSISGVDGYRHLDETVSSLVDHIKESERIRRDAEDKISSYLEELARYYQVKIKEVDESRV